MNRVQKFALAVLVLAFGCDGSGLTDKRDNKKYKTVNIGEQVWMAENLNFEADGSKCYDNKAENCKKYGRLYNWQTARTVCPTGWHLPDNKEWDKLYHFADGTSYGNPESPYVSETAGKFLKSTSGWNENGNGTNNLGFSALPSGGYVDDFGFVKIGEIGIWWSASNKYNAYSCALSHSHTQSFCYDKDEEKSLFSVRCIQD